MKNSAIEMKLENLAEPLAQACVSFRGLAGQVFERLIKKTLPVHQILRHWEANRAESRIFSQQVMAAAHLHQDTKLWTVGE